jgi:hypothetical protein
MRLVETVHLVEEEVTFGIYVLVVPKGFTRLTRTPVYLLDNVPLSNGGWGFYLPHGISIADYDADLFGTLRVAAPAEWKRSATLRKFITDQLDLIFPQVRKRFSFIGAPFSRYQFSRGRNENRLYWMIPISVSFFDQGKRYYKSRRFMNTWRWHSVREIQGNPKLSSIVSYILDPVIDTVTGEERRSFSRPVLGVRDSLGDFVNLASIRWIAVLTLVISLLTAFDLATKAVEQWRHTEEAATKRRSQETLAKALAAHKDAGAWADEYLHKGITRKGAADQYKEGCLIKLREGALKEDMRGKLAERMSTISVIYGPFTC